jgi:VWFA-related protein
MDRYHAPEKGLARVALFLLILGLPSISSPQQQASQEEPTFHSTTRLVVLDVVVTDQAGKPVTNLSQADFTLLEDGAAQSVASFESPKSRPDTPVSITSKSSKAEAKSPPNDSAPSPSALTILVLDELNGEVLDQAYARSAIQKFLRTHGPRLRQPTSLMLLGEKRLELLHDYSQDANALLEALHQRHAELPFGLMTAELSGAGERMSKTLWALQQIAAANNHFAGRKNVIWVGPGFPAINSVLSLNPDDRHRLVHAIGDATNLLFDARLTVYTINPRGLEVSPVMYGTSIGSGFLTGTQDPASGELVFESIAPETGGKIFRLQNDVDAAIEASSDDGAAYYTLAYYPSNRDWSGKFRRVRVTARGQNLQARVRNGYFAVPDAPPTDYQIDTVLSRAVMNPLPYRALSISASAKSAGPLAGRFSIKVDRPALDWRTLPDGKRRCEVTIVIASVGADDRVYSHKVTEMESLVDNKNFESHWDKPVTFNLVSDLPRSTRHVRIVVRDAQNGHIGTADLPRDSLPVR